MYLIIPWHISLIVPDVQDPLVQELIMSGYIFVLPERDRAGRRVVWSGARALDPARHNTSHVLRAHIATFEVRGTRTLIWGPIDYADVGRQIVFVRPNL